MQPQPLTSHLKQIALLMRGHLRAGEPGPDEYRTLLASIRDIESLPGADRVAIRLAHLELSAATLYGQPQGIVEIALREFLAIATDPYSRANAAASACVAHPSLRPYHSMEIARLRELPENDARQRALDEHLHFAKRIWQTNYDQ